MNTKRCPDCQKLLRPEAVTCTRCGHRFAEIPRRASLHAPDSSGQSRVPTRRIITRPGFRSRADTIHTVPPASPQRAGHYAGLHPEDQPYQSTMLPVQQVLALQAVVSPPARADVEPISVPGHESLLEDAPTYVIPRRSRARGPSQPPSRRQMRPRRLLPVAMTLIFLFLLAGGSFTAYALLNRRSASASLVLAALPNHLRVGDTLMLTGKGFGLGDQLTFQHDGANPIPGMSSARANDLGTFAVPVIVPTSWSVGQHTLYVIDIGKSESLSAATTITIDQSSQAPPQLALSTTLLNLGAAAPGVISRQSITLTNTGGRKVQWQASSDQPWLSILPASGTFSGSQAATISVNRGPNAPQPYTGHITFIQSGAARQTITLTVAMVVTAAPPASLTVSSAALAYLGTQVANPAPQYLVLQDTSTQPVDWSSAVITGNGANWLSLSPDRGHLAPHSSATVMVSAQSQGLTPSTYDGTIGFTGGTNPIISVTLNVVAPGNLVASPPSLSFAAVGQNPPAQTITLQNSGGESVAWLAAVSTVSGGHWLSASPASGLVAPGGRGTVLITVNAGALAPNSYQGTITLSYNGVTRQIPASLAVSVPPAPAIKVSQSGLAFSSILGSNPAPQTFNITNTGNAILHWAASDNGTIAPVSPSSGSLNPGQSATLTVSPNVSSASAGTLSTTITISDSDSGTKVTSQSIGVSIVIKDQAMIALSLTGMAFTQTGNSPSPAQLVTITNTGSQALNWTAQSSASWLSASVSNGSIAPGDSAVINVQIGTNPLGPGTYTATLTISDSDAGTPVAPQTLTVTLTVS